MSESAVIVKTRRHHPRVTARISSDLASAAERYALSSLGLLLVVVLVLIRHIGGS